MKLPTTLLLLALTTAVSANEVRGGLRMPDGSILRRGDTKVAVIEQLGFPHAQQGGVFYYQLRKKMVSITFTREGKIATIGDGAP